MDTGNSRNTRHKTNANAEGVPQRGTSEERPDAAATVPREVITGINPPHPVSPNKPGHLTEFPSVGERQIIMPGHGQHAVLISHPLPNAHAAADAAIIDWFACTLPLGPEYALQALLGDLRSLFSIASFTQTPKGWSGYDRHMDLGGCGLLAWEGKHQRNTAHLSLNAHGCARVPDWQEVRAWCEGHGARLRRIDLAHDDMTGAVWNADRLRREYLAGGFIGDDGGKPYSSMVGDWDNAAKGRTYYVGSRAAGKMLRGYEKGKHLGEADSPWFRLELELRGTNRVIPWDILTEPGRFLAGAYPCLAELSASPCSIDTAVKAASMDYGRTLAHLNKQWGQFVTLVHAVEGGDLARLFEKLSRTGYPARFLPQLSILLPKASDEDPDAQ